MPDISFSHLIEYVFTGPLYYRVFTIILILLFVAWLAIGIRIKNIITIEKISIYHIQLDENIYQIGLLVNFYNFTDKPVEIKEFYMDDAVVDLAASGTYYYRGHKSFEEKIQITSGNIIHANGETQIKALFPLKTHMLLEHNLPPEIVIYGKWILKTNKIDYQLVPKTYGNYEQQISEKEWWNLNTEADSLPKNSIKYKTGNKYYDMNDERQLFLLYNLDKTSKIDIYGFDQTIQAKSQSGIMVFVLGRGTPPLDNGWKIMGNSYTDVWSSPEMLKIYNAIHPPGDKGPRPFGTFVGQGEKIGLTESVPTTRPRGIQRLGIGKTSKDGRFTNMFNQ